MEFTRTDRIEQEVRLDAAPSRVWKALTDAREFGAWFGVRLEGPFAPGARNRGPVTNPGYEHLVLEVEVERMEAESCFAFRWHPNAVDPTLDYAMEPTTLVEFRLEAAGSGTLVKLVESGFERIPYGRREEARRNDERGWARQMVNLREYLH
jgi:uncharacterized protein YndB with AHSA1/START domain